MKSASCRRSAKVVLPKRTAKGIPPKKDWATTFTFSPGENPSSKSRVRMDSYSKWAAVDKPATIPLSPFFMQDKRVKLELFEIRSDMALSISKAK